MPATFRIGDMHVEHVGVWPLHCHTLDHIVGGMVARYEVLPSARVCDLAVCASRKTKTNKHTRAHTHTKKKELTLVICCFCICYFYFVEL